MNDYEEKKQARIDYYREKVQEASKHSKELYKQSDDMFSAIPFGQPILVGHHSEKSDRNYRNWAMGKFEKSITESNKAEYYAEKAAAAENNNAISSDDPDAIEKLKEKLEHLLKAQEAMKKANAYYRKHKTMKGYADYSDEEAATADEKIKNGYSWEQQPYASYKLKNNNGNMHTIKERIKSLEAKSSISADDGWEFNGGRVIMNTDENRVQVFFDKKPDEYIRNELKSCGFKWAPSNGVWQRQLNSNGIYAAKRVKSIQPDNQICM